MKQFVLLLFIFSSLQIKAQIPICGFDDFYKSRNEIAIAKTEAKYSKQAKVLRTQDSVKTIPVVVHVIHNGGTENITEAQIKNQIRILNEDYRKMTGTNGFGNGADSRINFCLATKNPDGKCTNGIVRIQSTLTNHKNYERTALGNLSNWDSKKYLNIYVVKSINNGSGTLGYASFPGGPENEDGIVILHNAFGDTGTVSVSSSYKLGRTLTHEVGHWLGLYHTFNNGCGNDLCAEGDYVCDTPPAINPNFGCPTINSCTNDSPDVSDQIENYMDYSNDVCKSIFTEGQATRMHNTLDSLRWDIWQTDNLISTGCDSLSTSDDSCIVIADFTSNRQQICVGNPVAFINKSLNNPTSYKWYFSGGSPATATTANVTVTYNSTGDYDVTLVSTNTFGQDSITLNNFITVTTPTVGTSLPFYEGFESTGFPANGIEIINSDNGITWERDTVAVAFEGKATAKINNLININYGQSDALVLPSLNLTSAASTPYLKFRWAYARSDANYSDEMIVLVSKDCGVNFTQLFYRTGTGLVTGTTQTTPYIPDSNTVWKSANISLANYFTYNNVIIKIVNVTDGGNNLYIDNISIADLSVGLDVVKTNNLIIYPNPATAEIFVSFDSAQRNATLKITDYMGRIIKKVQLQNTDGSFNERINLENLPPSIYFLHIKTGKEEFVKKFSKLKYN